MDRKANRREEEQSAMAERGGGASPFLGGDFLLGVAADVVLLLVSLVRGVYHVGGPGRTRLVPPVVVRTTIVRTTVVILAVVVATTAVVLGVVVIVVVPASPPAGCGGWRFGCGFPVSVSVFGLFARLLQFIWKKCSCVALNSKVLQRYILLHSSELPMKNECIQFSGFGLLNHIRGNFCDYTLCTPSESHRERNKENGQVEHFRCNDSN